MTHEPLDLAWAAGLFEGEGSVRINSRTHRNLGALLVDVVNIQPEITAFFADRWGGYRRQVAERAPRRSYWRWRLASLQAAGFLAEIQPYLRSDIYRRRVTLGIEYQAQKKMSWAARAPAYAARQHEFYLAMQTLNLRGVQAAEVVA